MTILKPSLAILDEADSGLDIDAIKVVSNGVNALRNEHRSLLIITHYQKLLTYIKPDFVHVFADGHIVKSGDQSLSEEIEQNGYAAYTSEQ